MEQDRRQLQWPRKQKGEECLMPDTTEALLLNEEIP